MSYLATTASPKEPSSITYVVNTGHYEGDTYLDILAPYIWAVKETTGLLVGVQTPPHQDLERYDWLRSLGVNRVSFCFEIFDPERFQAICPGKSRTYGLERYLEAVEYCAGLFDVTNGELIAGLEPPESSIRAIDHLTAAGAIPTLCVFRPLLGTDLEQEPPPRTADLVPVLRRLYEACMEQGLPIGVAPNVKDSLVLLPEECRYFSDKSYLWAKSKNAARAAVFRTAFGLSQKIRSRAPAPETVPRLVSQALEQSKGIQGVSR